MQSLSWSIRQPPRLLLALVLAVLLAAVALTTASMLVGGGKPTTQAHGEGQSWTEHDGKACTKYKGKIYCNTPG
jgi:hypothetical protein